MSTRVLIDPTESVRTGTLAVRTTGFVLEPVIVAVASGA
jgi:hypothetical protein